jgi:hypothetical protein
MCNVKLVQSATFFLTCCVPAESKAVNFQAASSLVDLLQTHGVKKTAQEILLRPPTHSLNLQWNIRNRPQQKNTVNKK